MKVEVNRNAPAVADAEALIEAEPGAVWGVLTDFGDWPLWNTGVSKMQFQGGLKAGATFTWLAGRAKITSRIEEVEPCSRIAWSGRTFGIRAMHLWELQERDGGTLVRTVESFDGFIAKLFRSPVKRMLEKTLRQALEDLKKETESRGGK